MSKHILLNPLFFINWLILLIMVLSCGITAIIEWGFLKIILFILNTIFLTIVLTKMNKADGI